RTPLTVIRASVEYLRRHAGQPVAEGGDALADIDAEVANLTSLVDDLLHISLCAHTIHALSMTFFCSPARTPARSASSASRSISTTSPPTPRRHSPSPRLPPACASRSTRSPRLRSATR